jgi:hypothetical protein
MSKAAILLAHINPLTNSHINIITKLKKDYSVYVFPVVFIRNGKEVNTKSFPFSYDIRKKMVVSIFGYDSVKVLPHYCFYSPYIRYLPPIFSPFSWKLKDQILKDIVEDKFVSYTGDTAERLMLYIYGFHPLNAKRMLISSSNVKEMLYHDAQKGKRFNDNIEWKRYIPNPIKDIIDENWNIIEGFANSSDDTIRILGMKFPRLGFF